MSIDKARVSRRFGRSAATYDRYAVVQRRMAERLVAEVVDAAPRARKILEIGCGTGYLTQLLCERFQEAELTAVDLSASMLEVASERLRGFDVSFLAGDAEERPWGSETFDLVVSSATIQWFAEPASTLGLLADSLATGGLMAHATFGPRTFEELHQVFRAVESERGLPPRTHGLELRGTRSWAELLEGAGLESVRVESAMETAEYLDCRAFLESVKRTGSSSGPDGGAPPAVARDVFLEVLHRYDREARTETGVRATYELVELLGTKPV